MALLRANARAARRRDADGPIVAGRSVAQNSVWAKTGLTAAKFLEEPTDVLDAGIGIDTDMDIVTDIFAGFGAGSSQADVPMCQSQFQCKQMFWFSSVTVWFS